MAMNEEEIERLLNDSDVDFSDDDDDDEYLPPEDLRDLHQPEESNEVEDEGPSVEHSEEAIQSTPRLFWRTKEMSSRGPDIADDELISQGSSEINTLYSFFEYLGQDFWDLVANQTNLYSAQKRDLRSVNTNSIELIRFSGVLLMMGTLKYPQSKLYWNRDLCVPIIRDAITRDRFFELRNFIHFADSDHPNSLDKLWKIRPVIEPILNKCHTLPRSKHMSIDEQMIPFSERCEYRQYDPSKPNPLGLKNFVLAARDGLVLDFEIYVGKNTVPLDIMQSLGLGGGIVQILCRTIDSRCVLYTDRFFTSLKLAEHLNKSDKEIYLTGTVMPNRIGTVNSKLKTDKQLVRGEWDEKVRSDENICILKWKDTKAVTMLSTSVGSTPADTCKRWCKVQKRKIDVNQPAVVKNYNTCMGGIDLCDKLIAYYRSAMRTRKWTVRVFSHFLDLVVVNCWIMYTRCCKEDILRKDKLGLLEYRINLAKALKYDGGRIDPHFTSTGTSSGPSCSTSCTDVPSLSLTERGEVCIGAPAKKHRLVVSQPIPEVRLDNVGHLPRYVESKFASKCRHPLCSSRCRTMCVKYQMFLCILKNNCFESYHTTKNFGP